MKRFAIFFVLLILSAVSCNASYGDLEGEAQARRAGEAKASVTPLMSAAQEGDIKALEQELAKPNVNINAQDVHGKTALFYAAQNNQVEALNKLLQGPGIDVDKPDQDGFTPLSIAVNEGFTDIASALFDHCAKDKKSCPNIETRDNRIKFTPLMRAVSSGNEAIVKVLLEHGANPTATAVKDNKRVDVSDLVAKNNPEVENEIKAARKKYLEKSLQFMDILAKPDYPEKIADAQKVLDNGIDVNGHDPRENVANELHEKGMAPLHWASRVGITDLVKQLLALGAKIDIKDDTAQTPLLIAAKQKNNEVAELLLQAGANINAEDTSRSLLTPLRTAIYTKNLPLVNILLKYNVDFNRISNGVEAPIHYAAYRGTPEIIKALLDKGIDINKPQDRGATPLLMAAMEGRKDIVEFLISQKADLDKATKSGSTPLMKAVDRGDKDITALLLKAGANVNKQNAQGQTALHIALDKEKYDLDLIQLLIEAQADLNIVDNNGKSLLGWLVAKGQPLLDLLIKMGIKLCR